VQFLRVCLARATFFLQLTQISTKYQNLFHKKKNENAKIQIIVPRLAQSPIDGGTITMLNDSSNDQRPTTKHPTSNPRALINKPTTNRPGQARHQQQKQSAPAKATKPHTSQASSQAAKQRHAKHRASCSPFSLWLACTKQRRQGVLAGFCCTWLFWVID
jgi:hypothetical protein